MPKKKKANHAPSAIHNVFYNGKKMTKSEFKILTGKSYYTADSATVKFFGDEAGTCLKGLDLYKDDHKGFGVRAAEDIKEGDIICTYVAERKDRSEGAIDKSFSFTVGDNIYDASKSCNIAPFFNHGVPNVYSEIGGVSEKVSLIALLPIKKGDKLEYDYGTFYDMNVFEHVDIELLTKRCNKLYDVLDGWIFDDTRLHKDAYGLDKKSPTSAVGKQSDKDLIINYRLLAFVFMRPMVLIQLKASGYDGSQLKTLWRYFIKCKDLSIFVENFSWSPLAVTMNIMLIDEIDPSVLDKMHALKGRELLRNQLDIYEQMCAFVRDTNENKDSPEYITATTMASCVFRITDKKYKDGGNVIDVAWGYSLYKEYFSHLDAQSQALLLEHLQQFPSLLECFNKQGISTRVILAPLDAKEGAIIEIVRSLLPEALFDQLQRNVASSKTINLIYKQVAPKRSEEFRCRISFALKPTDALLKKIKKSKVPHKCTKKGNGSLLVYFLPRK